MKSAAIHAVIIVDIADPNNTPASPCLKVNCYSEYVTERAALKLLRIIFL